MIDYLLKPIPFDCLLKAVHKFFDRKATSASKVIATESESFIYLKADRKELKVSMHEIVYLESLDVKVHFAG